MTFVIYVPYSRKDVLDYLETDIFVEASFNRSLINPDVLIIRIFNVYTEKSFIGLIRYIEDNFISYELYKQPDGHNKGYVRAGRVTDQLFYEISKGRVEIDWSIDKSNAIKTLELLNDEQSTRRAWSP